MGGGPVATQRRRTMSSARAGCRRHPAGAQHVDVLLVGDPFQRFMGGLAHGRVAVEANSLGSGRRSGSVSVADSLTRRELDVLSRVAQARATRQSPRL